MKYLKEYKKINWEFDIQDDEEKTDIPDDFENNEDFYNFLVDNNILSQYIYNFHNFKFENNEVFLTSVDIYDIKSFINSSKKEIINYAFDWSKTPEDHYFWLNYYNKWKNIIENR